MRNSHVLMATMGLLLVASGVAYNRGFFDKAPKSPEKPVGSRSEANRLCPHGWRRDDSTGVPVSYPCGKRWMGARDGFQACVPDMGRIDPADVQQATSNGALVLDEDALLNMGQLRIECR